MILGAETCGKLSVNPVRTYDRVLPMAKGYGVGRVSMLSSSEMTPVHVSKQTSQRKTCRNGGGDVLAHCRHICRHEIAQHLMTHVEQSLDMEDAVLATSDVLAGPPPSR